MGRAGPKFAGPGRAGYFRPVQSTSADTAIVTVKYVLSVLLSVIRKEYDEAFLYQTEVECVLLQDEE